MSVFNSFWKNMIWLASLLTLFYMKITENRWRECPRGGILIKIIIGGILNPTTRDTPSLRKKINNITGIDIDDRTIYEEWLALDLKKNHFTVQTNKGVHIYLDVEQLKTTTNILKVDIRNDNAILISPTKYLKKWRNRWIQDNTPTLNHIPEYILINLTSKERALKIEKQNRL
jgi:hypothetical protein